LRTFAWDLKETNPSDSAKVRKNGNQVDYGVDDAPNGISERNAQLLDRVVPRLGLEPIEGANKDGPSCTRTHKGAHKDQAGDRSGLGRVVSAWGKLPHPFKAAILAIVASVDGKGGEQ
jgi:hypothetical protein